MGPRELSYVVLDFETSGLSPTRHEVIETGAVHFDGSARGRTFHALSRPRVPLPPAATSITGLTDEDLAGSPPFSEVVADLRAFLGERVLVAHHARFDTAFLRRESALGGHGVVENPVVCTVRLSRKLFPELARHDLESLCRHHGIPRARRHRALDDAEATADLLDILLERAEETGISTAAAFVELGTPPSPSAPRPVRLSPEDRELLEDAIVTGDVVRLEYVSRRGVRSGRAVVPYVLDGGDGAFRLVAYDLHAGTTRTFRLDRVTAIAEARA